VNNKLIDRLAHKIEKGKENLWAGAVYFYSLSMEPTQEEPNQRKISIMKPKQRKISNDARARNKSKL
jgi:hypothetical protein